MYDARKDIVDGRTAAEYLGISYWLLLELSKKNELPCARVGGRILYRISSLDRFLQEKENKAFEKLQVK